jgi:hypothetical protein
MSLLDGSVGSLGAVLLGHPTAFKWVSVVPIQHPTDELLAEFNSLDFGRGVGGFFGI